jgi:hypothetical protein
MDSSLTTADKILEAQMNEERAKLFLRAFFLEADRRAIRYKTVGVRDETAYHLAIDELRKEIGV